jgi:hypothetical protein
MLARVESSGWRGILLSLADVVAEGPLLNDDGAVASSSGCGASNDSLVAEGVEADVASDELVSATAATRVGPRPVDAAVDLYCERMDTTTGASLRWR